MTSFNAAFSSDRLTYIRLRRSFSCSSFFSRLMSDASTPPYVAFHWYVADLMPYFRQIPLTERPSSASFRILTIWVSINFDEIKSNLVYASLEA